MDFHTKYSVGDTAYFTIFALGAIYSVVINKVYIRNKQVLYDLVRQDTQFVLEGVPEADVLSFIEAKSKLKLYLETKLTELNLLVAQ